jgi:VacB/RNase II family 3'-5' exoribonuclease
MPARKVRVVPRSDPALLAGLASIRAELHVPEEMPGPVTTAATAAAATPRALGDRLDLRDVPFVTIDPAGSRDLDQAYFAERRTGGTRVRYAIADVAAFVTTGDAVDVEAHARGVTVYLPDERAPLYPEVLGEGAASLLPDGDRPALCWTIDLDETGAATDWRLERATVRSRRQMTYVEAQHEIDAGSATEPLQLLREIGLLRQAQEHARGGVSLPLPDQEVQVLPDGYELAYEVPLAVEGWNAQISLLAGICAAHTMLDGGVGILRTLPPADDHAIERLRRIAQALGISWPASKRYADVVHDLTPGDPAAEAFVEQAVATLRGAGYTLVDPAATTPPVHGALATPYAHVTAPLRRLGDRIANEIVVALCAGRQPSDDARAALEGLPDLMREANRRAAGAERAVVDLAEALVLRGRIGETFSATVVDLDRDRATVMVRDPAVITHLDAGSLQLAQAVQVRLRAVDPTKRQIAFDSI